MGLVTDRMSRSRPETQEPLRTQGEEKEKQKQEVKDDLEMEAGGSVWREKQRVMAGEGWVKEGNVRVSGQVLQVGWRSQGTLFSGTEWAGAGAVWIRQGEWPGHM